MGNCLLFVLCSLSPRLCSLSPLRAAQYLLSLICHRLKDAPDARQMEKKRMWKVKQQPFFPEWLYLLIKISFFFRKHCQDSLSICMYDTFETLRDDRKKGSSKLLSICKGANRHCSTPSTDTTTFRIRKFYRFP